MAKRIQWDEVVYRCAECGGEEFDYPDDPEPEDTVTCLGCGTTGEWERVRRGAFEYTLGYFQRLLQAHGVPLDDEEEDEDDNPDADEAARTAN